MNEETEPEFIQWYGGSDAATVEFEEPTLRDDLREIARHLSGLAAALTFIALIGLIIKG